MKVKEPAKTPQHTWDDLLKISKKHRDEMKTYSSPMTKISIVMSKIGYRIYAISSNNGHQVTNLYSINVKHSVGPNFGNVTLRSAFDIEHHKPSTPNQEYSLALERQRLAQSNGVADYYADQESGTILLSVGDKIFRMRPDQSEATTATACAGNSQRSGDYAENLRICPCNTKLFSYVAGKKLYIENENGIIFKSTRNKECSDGSASFIEQEELDRFDATWWSTTKAWLLYESVDDQNVKTLSFGCPGKEKGSEMKYPLAGTANSFCSLRIIDAENSTRPTDHSMERSLQSYFPWVEYIARAGFLNDGVTVWVQAFDRQQQRAALILIPSSEFGLCSDCILTEPTIIYEENTKIWINTNNAIIPLDEENNPHLFTFLYGSEKENHCRLYLVGIEIIGSNIKKIHRPITPANFSVCKSTQALHDAEHGLVYYAANCHDFTETSICVSDYEHDEVNYKQLTPPGWSVKGERAYHRLALIPNFGFICYLTSHNQPPLCQFFQLYHYHQLPDAILTGSISITTQDSPTNLINPSDLPRFFKFQSRKSGLEHAGMVLLPPGADSTKKYPVLHYVYAGPGIQLVKNDFSCWVSYQKYTKAGYAVVVVDGRGSANRGLHFESTLKSNLGEYEVDDQVEGLQELARLMDGSLDLDRVVVHGWSYGGYMSLRLLAMHPNIYKAAIAGGAVVDWKFYDTAYTERYLGYPTNEAYDNCSLLKSVVRLPDEPGRVLILHGFKDENVHFRHTEALIDAMIRLGKPYQLQIFPQEHHGVRNAEGAAHLDATLLHFIQLALC